MTDTDVVTDPTPNLPLLREALAWARLENEKPWEQSQWYQEDFFTEGEMVGRTCDTAYCIAGWVAAKEKTFEQMKRMGGHEVEALATKRLGLTEYEADYLFSGSNDLEDVEAAAADIADRAGEEL